MEENAILPTRLQNLAEMDVIPLELWSIKFHGTGYKLEGIVRSEDFTSVRKFSSELIIKRITQTALIDASERFIELVGQIDRTFQLRNGMPEEIVIKFQNGFPKEWYELLKPWASQNQKTSTWRAIEKPPVVPPNPQIPPLTQKTPCEPIVTFDDETELRSDKEKEEARRRRRLEVEEAERQRKLLEEGSDGAEKRGYNRSPAEKNNRERSERSRRCSSEDNRSDGELADEWERVNSEILDNSMSRVAGRPKKMLAFGRALTQADVEKFAIRLEIAGARIPAVVASEKYVVTTLKNIPEASRKLGFALSAFDHLEQRIELKIHGMHRHSDFVVLRRDEGEFSEAPVYRNEEVGDKYFVVKRSIDGKKIVCHGKVTSVGATGFAFVSEPYEGFPVANGDGAFAFLDGKLLGVVKDTKEQGRVLEFVSIYLVHFAIDIIFHHQPFSV